eukprot:3206676-Rhodomonas_salina.1
MTAGGKGRRGSMRDDVMSGEVPYRAPIYQPASISIPSYVCFCTILRLCPSRPTPDSVPCCAGVSSCACAHAMLGTDLGYGAT